jgi:diacylglycerol kinase (ATP)
MNQASREGPPTHKVLRAFVVLNPVAGRSNVEEVRRVLFQHFSGSNGSCEIHETSGHENLTELTRLGVSRGVEVVIAAGGDGTVSGVAGGLVGTATPLGILPLGTTNVLARELGIPVDLEAACSLIAGQHGLTAIDGMRIGDGHYYTQIGVGIDSLMIRDTTTEAKRRYGKLAYIWSALLHLVGFQPRRFRVVVDGREIRRRASEIVVANSGTLGQPPLRWGPHIRPDDGRIDVCVIGVKSVFDYLRILWCILIGRHHETPHVRYFIAKQSVTISSKKPLPVQADGEIVGETPVTVFAVPHAVNVLTPRS